MAAEVNASNANQPSYLISNTDDVDDVIVRPIANVRHIEMNASLDSPKLIVTFFVCNKTDET